MASPRRSTTAPTERLLSAASKLFTKEGIRAVGVDRVLAEAQVARASLYQSFGSKDALVAAYIDRQHAADRDGYAKAVAGTQDPVEKLLAIFDRARTSAHRTSYRGCRYLNAATEFPDPKHPVAAAVARHRAWLRDILLSLLTQAGVADPDDVADRFQLIYDGAVAGSKFARSTDPIDIGRNMAVRLIGEAVA